MSIGFESSSWTGLWILLFPPASSTSASPTRTSFGLRWTSPRRRPGRQSISKTPRCSSRSRKGWGFKASFTRITSPRARNWLRSDSENRSNHRTNTGRRIRRTMIRASDRNRFRGLAGRSSMFETDAEESNHENKDSDSGTASPDGRVLAGRELSLGRPDLSLRQSVAETAADARGCEAHAAGTLGHDPREELHLRAPEPDHQEIRPRHDLRLRPRARRPGRRWQHLPRGHVQRDLSRHQPG